MSRMLSSCLFCLLFSSCFGQDARSFYAEATKALEGKNYKEYYASIQKAYALHPYNQNILWHMGMACALNHKAEEAVDFLKQAININTAFDLDDANLKSLKSLPAFQQLVKSKAILERPVIHSDTAFVLADRQLHLECVAFDPVGGSLFGGSIHKRKIIRIDSKGVVADYAQSGQYGLGAVFGVRVDVQKRILWACSSPISEMQDYDSSLASGLFQFDIGSGRMLNVYNPVDTLREHLFGDLVLDAKGIPYVSDTRNNIIYRYDATQNQLLPYFSSREFWGIQGITFSDNDQFLYIADYVKGIFALDIQTQTLFKVNAAYDLSLKGTDGMVFFDNSIITIQNGVQPFRVTRHYLDASHTRFIRYEYIDNAHPAFGEPTIGSIIDDKLYYVANSQWAGYENGKAKKAEDLKPIIILSQRLK